MNNIVLVAGGTAGHINPAIAMGQELEKEGCFVSYITDIRGAKFFTNQNYKILPIERFGWKFLLFSPYLFLKSIVCVLKYKKIVCFGGYTTLFPFIAGKILLKECFIFQLDSVVTRLNRLLVPFAKKVLYVFAQTKFKNYKNKQCVRMPLRKGFEFEFIRHKDVFTVAIVGGSLGSNYWKKLIDEALSIIPSNLHKRIALKIQTQDDVSFLEKYKLNNIETKPFYDTCKMFKQSHLVISRAGATTLAEISAIGRPIYIVPWEKAIENHQHYNAKFCASYGGAKYGNDAKILANWLQNMIESEEYWKKCLQDINVSFVKRDCMSFFSMIS